MRALTIDGVTYQVPRFISRRTKERSWRIAVAGIDRDYPDGNAAPGDSLEQACLDALALKSQDHATLSRLCPVSIVMDQESGRYKIHVPYGLTNDKKVETFYLHAPEARKAMVTSMKLNDSRAPMLFDGADLKNAFQFWCVKLRFTLQKLERQDLERALANNGVGRAKTSSEQLALF